MALLKAIETDFGIDATHWVIEKKTENYRAKLLTVGMAGYPNAATAADELAQPMKRIEAQISGEDYSPDMSRDEIYAVLVQAGDFANAESV